jgi:hypothetical protein
VGFFDFRRLHGLRKGQRQRVPVIGRGLAALLHIGLRLQHQQIAPVDVISRARQVGRHLLIRLDGSAEKPVLHLVPHIGLGAVRRVCTNPKLVSCTLLNPRARRRS